jgi:hypothetical protein
MPRYHSGMRSSLALGVSVGGVMLVALAVAAGCSGGSYPGGGDGGGDEGGSGFDASPSDAPSGGDATGTDAGPTTDGGGVTCGQLGGDYSSAKACTTAGDCTIIAKECYCGAQPIIGIAKTAAPAAASCETKAGSQCALGCANAPGHVAEDGNNDDDGGTIDVQCDNNRCHTVLR